MKEVQEKLLPGELGVSPRISLLIPPKSGGSKGVGDCLDSSRDPIVSFAQRIMRWGVSSIQVSQRRPVSGGKS